MAKIRVVNGVRFSDDGSRGIVDTDRNEWVTEPAEAQVIDVVDALASGDEAWTIYTAHGQTVPGPRLKTVGESEETEGIETHPGPNGDRCRRVWYPVQDFPASARPDPQRKSKRDELGVAKRPFVSQRSR